MAGTWRCKVCGNLNRGVDPECLDCCSEEWTGTDAQVAVGRRYSLTQEQWQAVQRAPLWTFKLVSEIDGNPDRQERQALIAMLNSGMLFDSFLLREACGAVARDVEAALSRHQEDPCSLEEAFCDVGRAVEAALSPSDAEEFKKDLVKLGVTIARASGGGLFGGADKMSEIEARALCFMATVLGVEPDFVGPGRVDPTVA